MLVTKQLTVAIEFHNMIKNTMDVNGYHQLLGELSRFGLRQAYSFEYIYYLCW